MKKLISISMLFALFIAIVGVTSCKKYEEGPKISFRSKKARLSGEWTLEQALHNTTDVTASTAAAVGANFVWEIEKDGTYKMSGNFAETGTWKLGEDKDDVTFTSSVSGSTADTYRILKLENKELWMKQTQSNGDVDEFHLKQ